MDFWIPTHVVDVAESGVLVYNTWTVVGPSQSQEDLGFQFCQPDLAKKLTMLI
jgi:hypothetical protein